MKLPRIGLTVIAGIFSLAVVSLTCAHAQADNDQSSTGQNDRSSTAGDDQSSKQAGIRETDTTELEEIVVTAQRRVQSFREVPTSLSVISGAQIERQNIKEAQDYLMRIPNVSFDEGTRRGSRSIRLQMRGVGNLEREATISNHSIGYYFDDVSVGIVATGTVNPQLLDIQQVEVLRGPQGTYFGLNAEAGAINIQSNKPNQTPYAKISGGAGRFSQWNVNGIFNFPISDTFMVRGVASVEQTPAIVKNANPVGGNSSSNNKFFRFSVRWLPLENVTVDATYSYAREEQGIMELVATGRPNRIVGIVEPGGPGTPPIAQRGPVLDGLGAFPQNQRFANISVPCVGDGQCPEYMTTTTQFGKFQLAYNAETFQITSITGYVQTGFDATFDNDGASFQDIYWVRDDSSKVYTQEVRVASTGDSAVDWIFGAFYMDANVHFKSNILSGADNFCLFIGFDLCWPEGAVLLGEHKSPGVKNWATFGNISWHATDRLTISFGGRYTRDKLTDAVVRRFEAAPFSTDLNFTQPQAPTTKTSAFTPKVSISFDAREDLTVYGNVARGYKAGGVREKTRPATAEEKAATGFANLPDTPDVFKEEKLWNYEIGLKGELFDKRLRVNLAAFYMIWKDFQVEADVVTFSESGNRIVNQVINAPKARSRGLEFDFTAVPTENITLGGAIGYLDAEFVKFPNASPDRLGPIDLSGKALPGAPKWTLNAFAEYHQPVAGNAEGFIRVEWRHRSANVPHIDGYRFLVTGENPWPWRAPSFDVVDLRLGITTDTLSITGYVQNLFGEHYYTGGLVTGLFTGGMRVRPHPRLWGVKVSREF